MSSVLSTVMSPLLQLRTTPPMQLLTTFGPGAGGNIFLSKVNFSGAVFCA